MKDYLVWLKRLALSEWCEYICGLAVLFIGSFLLGGQVNSWLLIVTVPIGLLGASHGIYRTYVKDESSSN